MDNTTKKTWVNKIINLDRRVVYLFIFLAIAIPFFLKPVVKMTPTPWVKKAFELVDQAAEKNKAILIGFDYDPSTLAELQPMSEVILRHAFSKNVKVMGICFMPNGTSLAADTLDKIAKEKGKTYGEDYVFMGFLPQSNLVLLNFGSDFRQSYKKDFRGNAIEEIPMLQNMQNYDDFHAVFDISGTKLPLYYILYGVDKYNFNFVAGVTAVSATEYYPYLQSGQMKGLLAGMKGAAEYEGLSGFLSDGMAGMASQTWGHLIIIFFIIVGNILYYIKRRMED